MNTTNPQLNNYSINSKNVTLSTLKISYFDARKRCKSKNLPGPNAPPKPLYLNFCSFSMNLLTTPASHSLRKILVHAPLK
jgi:hypothetical protein